MHLHTLDGDVLQFAVNKKSEVRHHRLVPMQVPAFWLHVAKN